VSFNYKNVVVFLREKEWGGRGKTFRGGLDADRILGLRGKNQKPALRRQNVGWGGSNSIGVAYKGDLGGDAVGALQ